MSSTLLLGKLILCHPLAYPDLNEAAEGRGKEQGVPPAD